MTFRTVLAEPAKYAARFYCRNHNVAVSTHQVRPRTTVIRNMEGTTANKAVTLAKGLPRLDAKDIHARRDCTARVRVYPDRSASGIHDLLEGEEKSNPTVGGNLVKWQCNTANLYYSGLFLATVRRAIIVMWRHEGNEHEHELV